MSRGRAKVMLSPHMLLFCPEPLEIKPPLPTWLTLGGRSAPGRAPCTWHLRGTPTLLHGLSLRLCCPPQSEHGECAPLRSRGPVVTAPIDPPVMGACHECPAVHSWAGGHAAPLLRAPARTAQASEWETPLKGPLLVSTASLSKYTTNVNSPTSYVYLHIYVHTCIKRKRCANLKIKFHQDECF